MAEQPITTPFQKLATQLREQANITELFKVARTDEFVTEASKLPLEDLKRLRDLYNARRAELDGKVRLDTFNGQVVNIVAIEWWHSEGYDNDGVSLTMRPEREPDKTYRSLTSSLPIVQFARRLNPQPSEQDPVRAIFELVPVTDRKRASEGHKKWSVRRLPPVVKNTHDGGMPF